MPGSTTAAAAWFTLRRRITIYPPEPAGRPGVCAVCRGPARTGYARCYQCAQHDVLGPGLLADAVVPISYAVKGTAFAASLWRYKSWRSPDPAARVCLLALLLTFLHDHGRCVWRHAGMPAPGRLAVVPQQARQAQRRTQLQRLCALTASDVEGLPEAVLRLGVR